MKKLFLVLSFLLILPALANSISNDPSVYDDEEYKRQMNMYNQQAKKAEEQLIETDR